MIFSIAAIVDDVVVPGDLTVLVAVYVLAACVGIRLNLRVRRLSWLYLNSGWTDANSRVRVDLVVCTLWSAGKLCIDSCVVP